MLIKQFEILWELPKCDSGTQSEQMLMEKWQKKKKKALLDTDLPQTFNLYKTKQNQYLCGEIK